MSNNFFGCNEDFSNALLRFGQVIVVGDVRLAGALGQLGGAVNIAGDFDLRFGFALDMFGVASKCFGGVVAVLLQVMNLTAKAAKRGDGAGISFWIGGELLLGFGSEQELGETGGSELQADFGELAGVVLAQVIREVVLEEPDFEGLVLFGAPFLVATARFPVGDVAFGDPDAVFVESADDVGVRDVVAKHAVDHVAFGISQAGDFAVEGLGF